MNEKDIIKKYEKITKSKFAGRLGNRFFFKRADGTYVSINLKGIYSMSELEEKNDKKENH